MERQTFPGQPNFESVADGDEPRTGFYLVLADSACIRGNAQEPDIGTEQDVRLVQLVRDVQLLEEAHDIDYQSPE